MSFLALVAALGLEQWRAFSWRASVERAFVRYARWIERKWNGGTAQHGWLALVVAIALPVMVVEGVFLAGWLEHPIGRPGPERGRPVFHDGIPPLQPRGVRHHQCVQGQ